MAQKFIRDHENYTIDEKFELKRRKNLADVFLSSNGEPIEVKIEIARFDISLLKKFTVSKNKSTLTISIPEGSLPAYLNEDDFE